MMVSNPIISYYAKLVHKRLQKRIYAKIVINCKKEKKRTDYKIFYNYNF